MIRRTGAPGRPRAGIRTRKWIPWLDQARRLVDQDQRARLYGEACRLVVADAADLWLYNTVEPVPVAKTVHGFNLLIKPFLGKNKGATKAEVLSRAIEHGAMKDAAAEMTQLSDDMLEHVLEESRIERLRIQRETDGARGWPGVSAQSG